MLNNQDNASDNVNSINAIFADTDKVNRISFHVSDDVFFQDYSRESLKQDAITDYIDGWQIDYLAFNSESNPDAPPIVILGGAFQNFNSYKYCIPPLLETAPVILIDLPATGNNTQTHNHHLDVNAKTLSMVDLSNLLSIWINSIGLDKVSMMGMSLGSVVASNFAARFPHAMHRLVLMGVMQRTRASWRMLIEESLIELDNQRMNDFGEAVVLYLVNHSKLDKTKMSGMARRLFHNQMAGFTYNEQLRYRINAYRLLNVKDVPTPDCPTLVATGQYDSFTLPHENAQFALACKDAVYAMVANADHVPQLQKRKETLSLFSTFLADKPIDDLKGIMVLDEEAIHQIDRRSDERISVNMPTTLTHKSGLRKDDVIINDISFFGMLLSVQTIEHASFIYAETRQMVLTLTDEEGDFQIELLLFEQKARKIRALFKHGSFKTAERLKQYLQQKKEEQLLVTNKLA